jgi:hypothetical protein
VGKFPEEVAIELQKLADDPWLKQVKKVFFGRQGMRGRECVCVCVCVCGGG